MFTQGEIAELRRNKNISKCSSKSITYSNQFKLNAVKQYYKDGYSPNMIFKKAGFNLAIIGKDRYKSSLRLWKKIYNEKGEEWLMKENRGVSGKRKKKIEFKSDKEKIEYLETKIKYLNAQNDFLAKLQGLERE